MPGLMSLADDTRFPDATRVICPQNRKGAVLLDDRDPARVIYKFSVRHGDISAEEAKQYAGRLEKAPNRAMVVLEGCRRQNGELLEFGGKLNWQPTVRAGEKPAPLLDPHPNAFCVLAQYNSRPRDESWKSPAFALDAKNIGGVEHIVASLNITVGGVSQCVEIGRAPMARRKHDVLVHFRNAAGKPGGAAKVWFNGNLIADYQGVTGHEGHLWSYHAFGLYRWAWSPVENTIDAWFENWREHAATAE